MHQRRFVSRNQVTEPLKNRPEIFCCFVALNRFSADSQSTCCNIIKLVTSTITFQTLFTYCDFTKSVLDIDLAC